MAVIPIRVVPDPVLRQKSKKVRFLDASTQRLVDDMLETLHDSSGAGLAAPQVGVPLRVIVIGIAGEEDIVLINPEIVRKSGERLVDEGCLSIPGYIGQLKRCTQVTAKGLDRRGKKIRVKGEELLAEVLEHEIDHLNGILYIDHLESPDKLHKLAPEEPSLD